MGWQHDKHLSGINFILWHHNLIYDVKYAKGTRGRFKTVLSKDTGLKFMLMSGAFSLHSKYCTETKEVGGGQGSCMTFTEITEDQKHLKSYYIYF